MRSIREIIEKSVLNYLLKNDIKTKCGIIVAYSGGPDSTVLLSVLSSLKNYGFNVTAAYFNHGLRFEDDLAVEEALIQRNAECLELPVVIGRDKPGNIARMALESGMSIEESARNARYDFLYKTMKSLNADYIATGHNLNDNSETILMRFFQNSGITGLSGIPDKRGSVIRPLCEVSRELIEKLIEEENIEYSTDKTNLVNEYLRNKIRLDIIPAVKQVFPEFDRNMAGFSGKISQYNDFIESESEKRLVWMAVKRGWKISVVDFYAEPEILRIKSLFRILNMVSSLKRIRYSAVEQAVSGKRHENGKLLLKLSDVEVYTANDFIFVDRLENRGKKSYLLDLKAGRKLYAAGQSFFITDIVNGRETGLYNLGQSIELLTDYPLIVRSYRDGDSIETSAGRKSLKKIFNEWKVRSEDKYRVPVVENSSRILAVIGKHLGYNNKTAPLTENDKGSLRKILLIINSDTETTGE